MLKFLVQDSNSFCVDLSDTFVVEVGEWPKNENSTIAYNRQNGSKYRIWHKVPDNRPIDERTFFVQEFGAPRVLKATLTTLEN